MLTEVADPQIPLGLRREPTAVDLSLVRAQPTLLAAIKLCISLGGFQDEKQVYGALGIDAGHWTRIMRGEAHFPVNKLTELMDLCGNEVPMLWLIHARGYDVATLRRLESENERKVRYLAEQLDAERNRSRILAEALHGRVAT